MGVSLGISQRPDHSPRPGWCGKGGGSDCGVLSVVLNPRAAFFTGDNVGRDGGGWPTGCYPESQIGARSSSSGETPWRGREEVAIYLCGCGHGIWSHNPGVFIHSKDIYLLRTGSPGHSP